MQVLFLFFVVAVWLPLLVAAELPGELSRLEGEEPFECIFVDFFSSYTLVFMHFPFGLIMLALVLLQFVKWEESHIRA